MTEHETAAFDALEALLGIIADPAVTKKRLTELRAASEDLARREAKLGVDREAFDAERARVLAEFQRERAAIASRLQMILNPQNHAYLRHRAERADKAEEAA